MARFIEQAVVIRLSDWSETSQIVTLLCANEGKVRGVAKGAKRNAPSSVARYSGGFQLLTAGEVVFNTRPHVELATLIEWDLQRPLRHLRSDLQAQRLGLYAADLANALLAEHDSHPRAYTELLTLLEALAEPRRHGEALLRFHWALLEDCGYRPELDVDVRGGEPLGNVASYSFDARAGGISASPSGGGGNEYTGPWRVRRQTVELLRHVAAGEEISAAGEEAVHRANRLLCVYARSILDRELPTMEVLL